MPGDYHRWAGWLLYAFLRALLKYRSSSSETQIFFEELESY